MKVVNQKRRNHYIGGSTIIKKYEEYINICSFVEIIRN